MSELSDGWWLLLGAVVFVAEILFGPGTWRDAPAPPADDAADPSRKTS